MKIQIGDDEYPFVHPAEAPSAALIALHKQSGLTFEVINDGLERLRAVEGTPEQVAIRILSDIEILLAVGAVVFFAKWVSGQRVSFEEATDLPFGAVTFVPEPGDEAVEVQGEALDLPDSVPGGNRAARRASTPSRSMTSKAASPGA